MTDYVLVHGGFVGGWYWKDVAALLEEQGHGVRVVEQMPSAGTDVSALGDLQADAACVRQVVDAASQPVVLVGHSYGGMVITELADHPAVAHSVYVSAFWPQRGQALTDFLDVLPHWMTARGDGTVAVTDDLEVARLALCADVPRERAEQDLRRLVPQSLSSLGSPSTAPDRTHPTTYVICEEDRAIPPQAQEQMAAAADHVERLRCSHQPMVAMPERLAAVLARAAQRSGSPARDLTIFAPTRS